MRPHEKVARVEAILTEIMKGEPKALLDPEPVVKVHGLDEATVTIVVRSWARREDYSDVRWGVNRAIKARFEEEGVELARPRPQVSLAPAAEGNESN